jgi:hypothetical protein
LNGYVLYWVEEEEEDEQEEEEEERDGVVSYL